MQQSIFFIRDMSWKCQISEVHLRYTTINFGEFRSGKYNCEVTTALISISCVILYIILCIWDPRSSVSLLAAGPTEFCCDLTVECGDWQLGFRRFGFYYECVRTVFPFHFYIQYIGLLFLPGYRQTTSLCPSVCHSMLAFDCTNFTGEKNAECTVLRRASLNYSTSLPLNSWFTLLSNTIMIVPPIEKRFFPLSHYFFFHYFWS